MSYGVFSGYYDLFTRNVDYSAYAERIDSIVTSLGLKRGSLVDLGCGTASLDIELSKLGYNVTGIDLSADMLTEAASKMYSSGQFIRLVNQDMTAFSLPYKADVIISTLDGINHLSGADAVEKMFSRVKRYLSPDGVFIFDMNTVYKHREVLADNCFIFDSDEAYLGWQNDYNADDDSVLITLDFFLPSGRGYKRYTEQFSEIAYPAEKIIAMLDGTGLAAAEMYDDLSSDKPSCHTERILTVVRHKK